jgi:hypothetical protein
VFDEIQSNASDDGDFGLRHGTKKLFDCHNLVCDVCGCVENVGVRNRDYFGLKPGLCSGGAHVEIWRRQDGFAPQFAAVGCDEADETIPIWRHCRWFEELRELILVLKWKSVDKMCCCCCASVLRFVGGYVFCRLRLKRFRDGGGRKQPT